MPTTNSRKLDADQVLAVLEKQLDVLAKSVSEMTGSQHADGLISSYEFYATIKDALLDQEFHDVIYERRHDDDRDGKLTRKTRNVLSSALVKLLEPLTSELKHQLAELKKLFEKQQRELNELLDERLDVRKLMMPGPLLDRFNEEYPAEKQAMVDRVADLYFTTPQRCFLQASTTILHLATVLRERRLGRNSLFHTNSTFFPYVMLGSDSAYRVYTVCGREHDPMCCGWLSGHGDQKQHEYILDLFRRDVEPLSIAFVTPQYLTADGALHFVREETAILAQLIAETAPHVVILSPAPRVYENRNDLPSKKDALWHSVRIAEIKRDGRRFEYILGGQFNQIKSPEEFVPRLAESLYSVCHSQTAGGKWAQTEPNGVL